MDPSTEVPISGEAMPANDIHENMPSNDIQEIRPSNDIQEIIPSNDIRETLPANDAQDTMPADDAQEKPPITEWQPPKSEEHPAGEEIRRQVEFYFSDENLPSDAHMLMKTGGTQNLPVTIKHMCGFPKMRRYKPYRSVVESLKKSTFLEVVDEKFIKRRVPLAIEPTIFPQKVEEAATEERRTKTKKVPEDKPWLTKGMMKPTGFEEFFADAPVTPAVFSEEKALYDKDITFETRIETAIQRYRARRKFHQQTAQVFNKLMNYGGIDSSPKAFGGSNPKDLVDKDAAEIAAMKATDFVSLDVSSTGNWDVDFEGVARGFLSCHIMPMLEAGTTKDDITRTTGVMRNFYNYLLYHDVCPEYQDQILCARRICDLADVELFNVVVASEQLPGPLSESLSALHGGAMAGVFSDDTSWEGADLTRRTLAECHDIVRFAFSTYGSEHQYERASEIGKLQSVYQEQMGLEVIGVQMADDETRALYANARKQKPFLSSLGKLHCRRWTYPDAPKFDHSEEALNRQQSDETLTFWVEDDILRYCFVGMKIEGEMRELDVGIKWLDSIRAVSASFFEYLPNELFHAQKSMRAEEKALQDVAERNINGLDKFDAPASVAVEA